MEGTVAQTDFGMDKINWPGQSESVLISKLKSGKRLEFGRADFYQYNSHDK